MAAPTATLIAIPAAAYLLGSIPFGLWLGRIFGAADIRRTGSGNIGATNVARAAGPLAGVLTLLLDAGKGALAVFLAERLSGQSATWMMIAGLCVIAGHCFPVWLGFRGGKGVATSAGAFLMLCPLALLAAAILFVLVVLYWRFVSLGSISAAAAMPMLVYFFWAPHHAPPHIVTFGTLAVMLLIVYKHDANIQRMLHGNEPKFSFRKNSGEVL
ncbi:MAG TPA: glycerol-3-phosphate 1-O-acyltransferase PlsY [Candidatus Acidoferrum sp.]|nr:glycerol-3-phosphate 1-O-acyltransferase PlsY [Candidatus Acidoferrum sp.]